MVIIVYYSIILTTSGAELRQITYINILYNEYVHRHAYTHNPPVQYKYIIIISGLQSFQSSLIVQSFNLCD